MESNASGKVLHAAQPCAQDVGGAIVVETTSYMKPWLSGESAARSAIGILSAIDNSTLARSCLFPFSEGFPVISVNMTEYYTIILIE